MSNYIEYNGKIAFHPGYYLREIVEGSGLTQEDFARRLGTTPKNLSILVRGEQSISIDIASKLSRMIGTTAAYWLNLQQAYDEKLAEILSKQELEREREVFKLMDYRYFRDHFHLPDLSRKTDEQIRTVREFLGVASLTALEEKNLALSFRNLPAEPALSDIVNANALIQIAVNRVLKAEIPRYNKKKFKEAADFWLTQGREHSGDLQQAERDFQKSGTVLITMPESKKTGIAGASKKVNGKMMLMVNPKRDNKDSPWLPLYHEIEHVLKGDLGASFYDDPEMKKIV